MSKVVGYTFDSFYDAFIVNQQQLDDNGKTLRLTQCQLKTPGQIESRANYAYEDQKEENFEAQNGNNGALFACPNKGVYWFFISKSLFR